jgi:hypothetical protein
MTLGSHQKTIGASQNWITPKYILEALGSFDLDPCACFPAPWKCAQNNLLENGLEWPWEGRVWLNPPFNRYEVGKWIAKLAAHGNGIALLHARTEAAWFEPCWEFASAILFLADRLYFHYPSGERAEANSGAPACLVAFGDANAFALSKSGLKGNLVTAWNMQ